MNYKNILLIACAIVFPSLFSREIKIGYKGTNSNGECLSLMVETSQNAQMDYKSIPQFLARDGKKKFKCCKSYKCCPRTYYDDKECNDCRGIIFSPSLGCGVGVLLGRAIGTCIGCCMSESCDSACTNAWSGDCSNCAYGSNLVLTGLMVASFVTAGCSWAPWFDKDGLNCCKKIEGCDQLNEDSIELEEEKNNDEK